MAQGLQFLEAGALRQSARRLIRSAEMRPSRPPSSRSNDQAPPRRRLFRPRPCADRGRPAIHRPGRLDETARTTRSGRPSSSLVERAYARWQRPPRKKQVMPWPVSLEQRSTGSATSTISSVPATPGRWQRANGGGAGAATAPSRRSASRYRPTKSACARPSQGSRAAPCTRAP